MFYFLKFIKKKKGGPIMQQYRKVIKFVEPTNPNITLDDQASVITYEPITEQMNVVDRMKMLDKDRADKVDRCGKSVNFVRMNGKIYASAHRCDDWICPVCSVKKKHDLQRRILYYSKIHKMQYFLTLTVNSHDPQKLQQIWRDIQKALRYEWQIRKVDTDKAKQKRLDLMMYDLKTNYFIENRWDISIQLMKEIDAGLLDDRGSWKGKKYIHLNPNDGERQLFYQQYKKEVHAELDARFIEYQFTEEYQKEHARMVENYEQSATMDFAWIRILEYQKKGRPYFHILLNWYPCREIIEKILKKSGISDVYDIKDLAELEGSDNARATSNYVVKYVTKDAYETVASLDDEEQIDPIDSSMNVKLSNDNEEKKGDKVEFIKSVRKLPRSDWEEIHGNDDHIDVYARGLVDLPAVEHPNPYVQAWKVRQKEMLDKKTERIAELRKQHTKKKHYQYYRREFETMFSEAYQEQHSLYYCQAMIYELERRKNVSPEILRQKRSADPFDSYPKNDVRLSAQRSFLNAICDRKNTRNLQSAYNFEVLLGGAGTGKTTVLEEFFRIFDLEDKKVGVGAYTGKAVARIREKIGQPEKTTIGTIHSLLHSRFGMNFLNDQNNPLDYDVMIIDEVGMLPRDLFVHLLNALKPSCKIIMLGDWRQLLPVRSSSMIDELKSIKDWFPVRLHELTHNWRSGDSVNRIAYEVSNGQIKDEWFASIDIEVIKDRINDGWQVLTNSNALSKMINQEYTADKMDVTFTADYNYDVGDPVLVLRNDRKNGVYNGDVVRVSGFDADDRTMTLQRSDGYEFVYANVQLEDIQPAFSMTVHKSQGSEYAKVLICLDESSLLLNRNILYTAITRAKEEFYLMKKEEALITDMIKAQQSEEPHSIKEMKNMMKSGGDLTA